MTGKYHIILLLTFALALSGCSDKKPRYERKKPVGFEQKIRVKRYEKALFEIHPDSLQTKIPLLQNDFKFFLGGDRINQQELIKLYDYVTDPALIDLYKNVSEKYPDNQFLVNTFTKLFGYWKAYYPSAPVPVIYTYISGLDYSRPVILTDSLIIISLDMYLGRDFDGYREMGIPKYKRAHFQPGYIAVDVVNEIALSEQPVVRPGGKLIDRMIFHGKQLYFKDALLPDIHDTTKIKYTGDQLQWIEANEKMIWSFIIENELLFTGNYSRFKKLLSDGPFTSEFGRSSAPRIAQWIGWQIVRDYMEANPSVSLKQLMQTTDSQSILDKSGYKP